MTKLTRPDGSFFELLNSDEGRTAMRWSVLPGPGRALWAATMVMTERSYTVDIKRFGKSAFVGIKAPRCSGEWSLNRTPDEAEHLVKTTPATEELRIGDGVQTLIWQAGADPLDRPTLTLVSTGADRAEVAHTLIMKTSLSLSASKDFITFAAEHAPGAVSLGYPPQGELLTTL